MDRLFKVVLLALGVFVVVAVVLWAEWTLFKEGIKEGVKEAKKKEDD